MPKRAMGSLTLAAPGLVLLVAGPAMAWLVFAARPDRPQNRRLAALLLVTAFALGSYAGLRIAMESPADAFAGYSLFALLLFLLPFLYIRFLATLDTPLRRVLASRLTQAGALALGVTAQALWFARPDLFVSRMSDDGFWRVQQGPLNIAFIDGISGSLMLLGLVVAVLAWRHAPTPLARRQAGIYALAFGVRDAVVILWVVVVSELVDAGTLPVASIAIVPLGELLLVLLLAYGILRAQLFDIELRLKWTLRKGTLAAIFVGVFFVVSEGAQELLSAQLGPLFGLLAAGMLVLAISPLQRVADRLADSAMPRVRDDDEYRTVRKREVYQAAVEGVLEDGAITDKERSVLARLQDQLGLSASEALEIEREATRARAA